MNEIVIKLLLAGDKFMSEIHLKQPALFDKSGFTYSACGLFTKNKEWIKKFKETGDTSYIYKTKLDKACFEHNMAYGDFKDLAKEQILIKFWEIKHLVLQNILRMMGIKEDWLQWFTNFLIKIQKEVVWLSLQIKLLLVLARD